LYFDGPDDIMVISNEEMIMIEYKVKVYEDGTKVWYLNGVHHREDGPAIERVSGINEWYLNGNSVTENDVMTPVKELTVAEIEQLLGYKVKVVK